MSGFNLRSTPPGSAAPYWLDSIAYTDGLTIRTAWGQDGGGFHEVQWEMDLSVDYDHPALRRGALVEVMDGALRVGQAVLSEPGRTESGKSFIALGLYRQAEHFLCFDGAGNSTTTLDTAVNQAISRGAPFNLPASISTTPMKTGDATTGLNKLHVLASSVAVETNKRWWIDADGGFRMTTNETEPSWLLRPGVTYPGVADDDYAAAIFGRYISSPSNTLATGTRVNTAAAARWGYNEEPVDLTGLGPMLPSRVAARLDALMAAGKARLAFTERIEVGPNELLTAGGRPASLSMVRAGQVVRVHGLNSYSQWLDGNPYLDFVIGETEWANGADTISIAPEQFSGRSLADRLTVSGSGDLVA